MDKLLFPGHYYDDKATFVNNDTFEAYYFNKALDKINEIVDLPSTNITQDEINAWNSGTGHAVTWDSIVGKPFKFNPAPHTHTASDVDGVALSSDIGNINELTTRNKKSLVEAVNEVNSKIKNQIIVNYKTDLLSVSSFDDIYEGMNVLVRYEANTSPIVKLYAVYILIDKNKLSSPDYSGWKTESLSSTQLAATNSGITVEKVEQYDGYAALISNNYYTKTEVDSKMPTTEQKEILDNLSQNTESDYKNYLDSLSGSKIELE